MDVRRHPHEADRLASLDSYAVLDTPAEPELDSLTRLAAQICRTPMAAISLVDENRQWFLSCLGMEGTGNARSQSVCSDVVASAAPLVVPDLRDVPRYADLPAVTGPHELRAYAGVPLIGRDGLPLGALCVLDTTPRQFSAAELAALADLGHQVMTSMELRRLDASSGLASPELVTEAREPETLRRALDDGQFVPFFQPLVDMRTNRIEGLEALIRWRHPTRGLLTPDTFLPGLEAGVLADWTGQAVLEASCELLVELADRDISLPDGVAVNVSGRQLTRPGLARRILDTLGRYDLPGRALTVEITEATEVSDVVMARAELLALRGAGVRVVADDFGVGWSNLVRLLELPLSGLKIDKEIVTAMVGDRVRAHMVTSTVALAHQMGIDVLAEGVETEAVRDRLLAIGCYRGQGWLFHRAVPSSELPDLLAQEPRRPFVDRPADIGRDASPAIATIVKASNADVSSLDPGVDVGTDTAGRFAAAVLDALPDATAVLDRSGTIIAVNRAWRMFTLDNGGDPEKTGVGINYLDVCTRAADHGSPDALAVLAGLRAVLAGETVESDREYPCPSPTAGRWFASRITPIADRAGGAVASHVNISRRKMSEQELLHRASHDPLTGLANRILFVERLTSALTPRPGRSADADVGLLYIDLDRFKPVNDTFGHDAGDEILLAVAHRLRFGVRPQDTVARLGGDEFAVCAVHVSPGELAQIALRLQTELAEPHWIHGHRIHVPASIGVHRAAAGEDPARAINRADRAMYATKNPPAQAKTRAA